MKKPQISLEHDVYASLKRYCGTKGKKLSHVATQVLRSFLDTEHKLIESEGNMIIQGEREKPKTIVAVLEEDQEEEEARRLEEARRSLKEEPRRSPEGIEIVKKGNRYIVKKRKAK